LSHHCRFSRFSRFKVFSKLRRQGFTIEINRCACHNNVTWLWPLSILIVARLGTLPSSTKKIAQRSRHHN
jgi:hypothetical protein